MLSLRRILVPTDFSPASDRALAVAIQLARGQSAEILVLHVQERAVDHYGFGGSVEVLAMQERTQAIIDAQLQAAATKVAALKLGVRLYHRRGDAWDEIVKLAREGEVDLIALSTHGRSSLGEELLGSTTERVVRKAPCSVLVVRPPAGG